MHNTTNNNTGEELEMKVQSQTHVPEWTRNGAVITRGQGYGVLRYLTTEDGTRLFVDIERNAYDQQSHYRISRWDGNQWQVVAVVGGMDPQGVAMPSYVCWTPEHNDPKFPQYAVRTEECRDAVEHMAGRLLELASEILGLDEAAS
jgi:hypothetical protein